MSESWRPPPPPPPPSGWGPYSPGPQYPPPYPPQPGQRTEPLSTWSLVLGILSFFVCPVASAIAAIIVGSRAKKAIDRSGGTKTGGSTAVAGQVLGWINIALSVVVGVVIVIVAVYASHHQSYTSLRQGDCFNRSGGLLSGLVSKVSCDKPHQQEVIGTFQAPNGGWPGTAGIQAIAQPECAGFAQQYLNTFPSGLQLLWIYPDHQSWNNGTRTVVCTLRNANGTKRTGSLREGAGSA